MQKSFTDQKVMHGICRKCSHRERCKRPCGPVQEYLAHENRAVFEKTYTDESGQTISVVYSRPKEINFSAFQKEGDTPKNRPNRLEMALSTENESAFSSFTPDLKQTRLFIDKFFFKMSLDDLAAKYEMSKDKVSEYYIQARKRLFALLEALDSQKRIKLDHYWALIKERSGSLPKGQRYFLMNKIFLLTPQQISEIENTSADSVGTLIRRTSDQLRAGEIRLFDFTEEEAIEAKQRLDRTRERRREREKK